MTPTRRILSPQVQPSPSQITLLRALCSAPGPQDLVLYLKKPVIGPGYAPPHPLVVLVESMQTPRGQAFSQEVSQPTVINGSCRRGEPLAPPPPHRSLPVSPTASSLPAHTPPACRSHKSQFTRVALVGEEGSAANDGSSAGFFMLHSHKFLRTAWAAR